MPGWYLGFREAQAYADAIPPSDQTILTTEETGTLGSKAEKREHGSSMEIGQADTSSRQLRRFTNQVR
jgi:hypothetical protein